MPKIFLDPSSESPVSSASYDPRSGLLRLEFDEGGILSPKYFQGRHIDAVTIDGDAYEIELHADDGPRDARGRYIYDRSTLETEFTVDIGQGRDVSDGLEFGLADRPDGSKQLYAFELAPPAAAPEPAPRPAPQPKPPEAPAPIEVPSNPDLRVFFHDTFTDERLFEVADGDEIVLDRVEGRDVTLVVAEGDFEGIESMRLELDGVQSQVESFALYVLHGNRGDDLKRGARLEEGEYDFSVDAYSGNGAKGALLAELDMSFRIVDDPMG